MAASCIVVLSCYRQLRLSCTDSDSRLAQIIKEKFISRVRVATQVHPPTVY